MDRIRSQSSISRVYIKNFESDWPIIPIKDLPDGTAAPSVLQIYVVDASCKELGVEKSKGKTSLEAFLHVGRLFCPLSGTGYSFNSKNSSFHFGNKFPSIVGGPVTTVSWKPVGNTSTNDGYVGLC